MFWGLLVWKKNKLSTSTTWETGVKCIRRLPHPGQDGQESRTRKMLWDTRATDEYFYTFSDFTETELLQSWQQGLGLSVAVCVPFTLRRKKKLKTKLYFSGYCPTVCSSRKWSFSKTLLNGGELIWKYRLSCVVLWTKKNLLKTEFFKNGDIAIIMRLPCQSFNGRWLLLF